MKTVPEMLSNNFAVASSLFWPQDEISPAPTNTTLPDEVGLGVGVRVLVAFGIGVAVRVAVGFGVRLLMGVGVRVALGFGVRLLVGVAVRAAVGVKALPPEV